MSNNPTPHDQVTADIAADLADLFEPADLQALLQQLAADGIPDNRPLTDYRQAEGN